MLPDLNLHRKKRQEGLIRVRNHGRTESLDNKDKVVILVLRELLIEETKETNRIVNKEPQPVMKGADKMSREGKDLPMEHLSSLVHPKGSRATEVTDPNSMEKDKVLTGQRNQSREAEVNLQKG